MAHHQFGVIALQLFTPSRLHPVPFKPLQGWPYQCGQMPPHAISNEAKDLPIPLGWFWVKQGRVLKRQVDHPKHRTLWYHDQEGDKLQAPSHAKHCVARQCHYAVGCVSRDCAPWSSRNWCHLERTKTGESLEGLLAVLALEKHQTTKNKHNNNPNSLNDRINSQSKNPSKKWPPRKRSPSAKLAAVYARTS